MKPRELINTRKREEICNGFGSGDYAIQHKVNVLNAVRVDCLIFFSFC